MKRNIISRSLTLGALALAAAVVAPSASGQSTNYTWNGALSTSWGTAGNWSSPGMGPTNGTYPHRLNVYNAAASPLVYTASEGFTTYGTNGIRGLVVGSGTSGEMTISGGTFATREGSGSGSLDGGDVVGNGDNRTGILNVSGGNFISGSSGLALGLGGGTGRRSVLNVNSGSATIKTLLFNSTQATANLNGGTLAVNALTHWSGATTNNFNGGTLQARTNSSAFIGPLSRVNVRDGGAIIDTAGFAVTVGRALEHSDITGDAAIDGGLTKKGAGTLTLNGTNTYTGPTVVNQGSLGMKLPSSSSALTLADGTAATITVNDSSWTSTSVSVTNATLNFAFGNVVSLPSSIIPTSTLNASGSNVINIVSGAGLPAGITKLIDHGGSKNGSGTFTLGPLPVGLNATLGEDSTSVYLDVSSSVQALVWSGSVDNIWATNGVLNWNSGTAAYQEYVSGFGDIVTFNDTAGSFYTVSITNDVKPLDVLVNIPTAAVTFSGDGRISGTTGLTKSGAGILTLVNTNTYAGQTVVSGGTLQVNNGLALGSTAGGTTATNGGTLAVGDLSNTGVTVTGETITISGAGVGGAKGALRGVDSGDNVWAGPVIIASNESRIGTEDGGNLTVSGTITEAGTNLTLIIRPGAGGTVTISGTGSSYGQTRTYGDGSATGVVKVGANNAFATNSTLALGLGFVDLNGFNQTIAGLFDVSGPGTIVNNGGSPSTLTINTGTNTFGSPGSIVDGASTLSLVKLGTGTQQFYGASVLSYSGNTAVSEGRLDLYVTNMASAITVAGGATLAGEPTTTGSLTLNANSALIVDPSTTNCLTASTVSATAGPISVSFSGAFSGDALVLAASGGITGSAANFQAVGGRGGSFYLTNSNTELYFSPAVASLVWKGDDLVNPTFWDLETTTNWLNSGSPDIFFSGDNVLFNDSASSFVVAPQGTMLPSSVTFNNSISNYAVAGVIGAGTVSKSGSAVVALSGNNSYSGETHVTAGTLVVENNNALGSKVGGTTVSSGGTLDFGGAVAQDTLNIGAEVLTISGAGVGGNGAVVNNGSFSQYNAAQRVVLAGDASIGGTQRWDIRGTSWLDMGGYTLTKKGSNYFALVGTILTNTPGNVIVEGGTFAIQLGADLGGTSANSLTLQSGSILNNYATSGGQAWSLVMNSNTVYQANVGSASQNIWSGPVTLNGPAALEVNAYITISGNISGTGSITKTGTGTVTLSGNNSYGGSTTVSGGRLNVEGTLSTGPVSLAATTTLGGAGTIGGTVTMASTSKLVPGNTNAPATLTVASLVLSNATTADFEIQDSFTLDKVAVTASGGLTLGECGINLYVPGTATAFATDGTYTLFTYSGTLNGDVANLSVLNPQAGKTYVFTTNATEVQLTIGTVSAPVYWGVDSDGSWASAVNWSPNTVPSAQFDTASIGGPGSPVTFLAPHVITLDGTYTLGALVLDTAQPFTVNQGSGGALQFDNGSAAALITETSGSHTINAPLALSAKGLAASVAASTTLSLNGGVSGTGGLNKSTTGTLLLGGSNSYSGITAVSQGYLVVSNNAALGSTAGATLLTGNAGAGDSAVTLANGVTVTGESITINGYGPNVRGSLQAGSGATAEWAGPVILGNGRPGDNNRVGAAANGTLTISGPITNGTIPDLYIGADASNGKVIVSGANTFSGKVGIIRGTLQLGANNSLPATALMDVHSASSVGDISIFEMAGYNQTVAGLQRGGSGTGASVVTNSGSLATLTISGTNSYSYPGYLGGAITLVKNGSGTQTLTAATTYTGDTTVNAGTLVFSQAALNTNSTISVATNAVLQLNFATTNQVAALVLNGASQPPGVYDSTTGAPYITGTGSLLVPSAEPPTLTYTNLGGNQLQFTWEGSGVLQAQTNNLSTGLSTNWGDYPGGGTSPVTVTIDPSQGSVFFRVKQ